MKQYAILRKKGSANRISNIRQNKFLNFLGLSSQVPDTRIIWKIRETLTKAGIIEGFV